ncbi:MAG: L-arabinose isomerase [Kiritimatiellaeota bacterium]|nr:L-arabinose isomerase [Kiritimatiellota bacterium]
MKKQTVYFVTGSQGLYGEETLRQVAANSKRIVAEMNASKKISVQIVWQPTVISPEGITAMMRQVNNDEACVGVITWMHTFSPAKMWIGGLKILQKPLLHFATQANELLPWGTIDMDFMNLNQAAHGDREYGFICTRLNVPRKVVVGYRTDPQALRQIDTWARVARGWNEAQTLRVARIGDTMREVAVTEGNKVSAQINFGFAVNTYGAGDVVAFVDDVSDAQANALVEEYGDLYTIKDRSKAAMAAIRAAARQEIGIRAFLDSVGAKAITTTFEVLHGLDQLPGLACQRLMGDGYGFGAEGDWKTSAMLRIMKVMAEGLKGGTSFMEDYTYHLKRKQEKVLGSHMLEVCPTIADRKPTLEVHPLGIGGKADPARLVFNSPEGPAINVSLIDLGDDFRLIVNEVTAIKPEQPLPKLPVARTVWVPKPDFHTGVQRWIESGGAHHTVYSQALTTDHMRDFAEIADVELVVIA